MSTALANPTLVRLDKRIWLAKVQAFAALKEEKKKAAAASAAADEAYKAARAAILRELGTAKAAVCGDYVLSVKTTAGTASAITLADSRRVKWDAVTSLLIGNETVKGADVVSVYGGRSGSIDVDVAGGVDA